MSQAPDRTSSARATPVRDAEPPNYGFRPVRTRALDEFEAQARVPKWISIVAPVGYGKTVLMTEMHGRLEARGDTCHWIALDERDGRCEDLLQRLEQTLPAPVHAAHPTQALFRGDSSVDARLTRWIAAASAHAGITVFIDNLHHCSDPQLGTVLDRLLLGTPQQLRFVVSGTSAPPVHLARAKLEGHVREVGYESLCLDLDGLRDLLGAEVSAALGPHWLSTVLQQTEGWPAAARMMQLAMASSTHPRLLAEQFSGSDEDLVALLHRQVLHGLPAARRRFLLDIAVLHDLDADLCAYATGDAQAGAHLDWLVRHNVFMVPLDRRRERYRLHGLFRQCLLGEARRQMPAPRHRDVLLRAAQFSEPRERWRDAIEYALAAQAPEGAARALEACAPSFVRNRGDTPQYISWASTLLKQGQTLGREAEYWYVWALVLNQRYEEGRHHLERFARRLQRSQARLTPGGSPPSIERRLDILRMCIAVFTDRLEDADRDAARWLAHEAGDDPFDITVARCVRSMHAAGASRFVDARAAVQAAQASAAQTHSEYAQGWLVALRELPSILEGHYAVARPALLASLEVLGPKLGDHAGICGTLALLAAHCAVEMGDDANGRELLDRGLPTAHAHGFVDALASGLDAALKLWDGTANDACVARLQHIAGHYPPRLAFLLGCQRVRRLLRLQRTREALAEADRLGLDPERPDALPVWASGGRAHDLAQTTLADLLVTIGRTRAAELLIGELMRRARAEHRVAQQVELLLMQTALALRQSHKTLATRHLTRGICLAAPHGIQRPFRDMAHQLAPLIEDTRPSSWAFVSAEERTFFAELCRRLPLRDRGFEERWAALHETRQFTEVLTPRQLELLNLLEAGLSNQQIADRIDRTLTTVKGHLQALYAKLEVASRSAALARARMLGLI